MSKSLVIPDHLKYRLALCLRDSQFNKMNLAELEVVAQRIIDFLNRDLQA